MRKRGEDLKQHFCYN